MNAKQAKEMALKMCSVEMSFLIEEIASAAEEGKFKVEVEQIGETERESLVKLGYEVHGTTIEW